MTPATANVINKEEWSGCDKVVGAVRQVAHVADQARLLKTLATDAVEDGVHAAKRALTRTVHDIEDLHDAATSRIRRTPIQSAAAAFGAGILVGAAVAWTALSCRRGGSGTRAKAA